MGACNCTEARSERNAATLDQSFQRGSAAQKAEQTQETGKEAVFDFLTEAEKSMKSSLVAPQSAPMTPAPLNLGEIAEIPIESHGRVTTDTKKTEEKAEIDNDSSERGDLPDNCSYILSKLTLEARTVYVKLGPWTYLSKATAKTLIPLNNGGCYIGDVDKARLPHGFGLRLDEDLTLLEGKWQLGVLHGPGLHLYPSGDYYRGSFASGEVQGVGQFERVEGASYEGEWKDSRQSGKGVETWKDGSVYTGNFREGKKEGLGTFKWADGSRYEGEFRNNQLEGQGKYMWSDGRVYEGQWLRNKMHGTGKFAWPDGKAYEGGYVSDQKSGFGVFRWPNGKLYEGNWQDNRMNGCGTVVEPSGKRVSGVWANGQLKSSH